MKNLSFLFVLLLSLAASCSNGPGKHPAYGNIDAEMAEIENSLSPSILVKGEPVKRFTLAERMAHHHVPGVSIALVNDGKIRWAKGYGIANTNDGTAVDENTLFQAGSISKPLAALAALKLVEEGKLELDQDVNIYLKDWKIPDSELSKEEKVTLRRLLTHTAGMTVHGFPGYRQTDSFPPINTVLNGQGNTAPIFVDTTPGSIWRYSGGGYTVMEKVVEDVSGLALEQYMHNNVFQPMGLARSTYAQPLPAQYHATASAAYDNQGKIIDGLWHNYPEQAAAGLWTTPSDLARYCIAIQEILKGKTGGVLSKKTVEMMLTKDKNDWGLGPSLKGDGDELIFQHGGKNAGFTNNMVAFANRGDAVIIMTNADNGGRLMAEIMRSVANFYNWEIASRPREIELLAVDPEQLKSFTGRYKLQQQVPGVGDYYIEARIEKGQLLLHDANIDENRYLSPIDQSKFIDLENGDEVVFEEMKEGRSTAIVFNNRYRFNRAE